MKAYAIIFTFFHLFIWLPEVFILLATYDPKYQFATWIGIGVSELVALFLSLYVSRLWRKA